MHDQIDNIVPFSESFPELESITLNITEQCNLYCNYCFERHKSNKFMSIDTLKHILTSLDISKLKQISFFGGEPLLNWKLIKECVLYFNERNLHPFFGITTNLTLLIDDMLDFIDDFNIHVMVSLDGMKEYHDLHRCNTWDLVISNLQKLLDRDLHHLIEIRYTLHPDVAHHLFDGVKNIADMGLNYINPVPVTDVPWTDEQLQAFDENHQKLLPYYIDLLKTERNISIKDIDDVLYLILEPMPDADIGCNLNARNWIAIDVDGNVYPCHRCAADAVNALYADMRIGNVYQGIDLTQKQHVQQSNIRQIAKDAPQKCFNCDVYEQCKLGCVIENLYLSNRRHNPSDAYCKLINIVVKNVKHFRTTILTKIETNNGRINVLKENLKLKEYFQKNIFVPDVDILTYLVRLDTFQSEFLNLEQNDILLPRFKDYFLKELAIIASSLLAFQGKVINDKFEVVPIEYDIEEVIEDGE
jgi:uncharacterized protein